MMIRPLLWLAIVGCGGDDGAASPVEVQAEAEADARRAEQVTRYGWVSEVAYEPERFADLTATGRDGWIAMHAHDYTTAVAAFGDEHLSRARAELALAILHDDLARLSGLVNEMLYSEWEHRTGLPEGNAAPLMAALASHCADGDTTAIWAGKVADGEGFAAGRALVQGRSPFDGGGTGSLAARLGEHRKARQGAVTSLLEISLAPLMVVDEGEFSREFWDPCVYRSLSDGWFTSAGASLGGTNWRAMGAWAKEDSLVGRIFAPWPTNEDLATDLITATDAGTVGAQSPSMRKLGLGTLASSSDDAEAARRDVRTLDVALDGWRTELASEASDDGRELLINLGLVDRFRQEWLVTRARAALLQHRPQQALVMLEHARDKSSRSIGPANGPSLHALLSEAHLMLGHTREALDPLHVLVGAHPEALGLRETLADLAVLRGVDRNGDSKEVQ